MDREPIGHSGSQLTLDRLLHFVKQEKLSPDLLQYQEALVSHFFKELQSQVADSNADRPAGEDRADREEQVLPRPAAARDREDQVPAQVLLQSEEQKGGFPFADRQLIEADDR